MSTPTLGSKPLPETRISLVGGPVFFESVIDGAAKAVADRRRNAPQRIFQPFARAIGDLRGESTIRGPHTRETGILLG